ncbi:hypothetical protein HERIO_2426 [Hepatospora eriocheir]|uniref:Uncharacterized protein n=1 Tax=Hepatospora eriocheir TaxID=1081669 RepID=A0A1X0Q6Z2_9MICR|nr:hypothetical protein HERIO_2426 [Hepatospora eriocheir]
MNDFNYRSNKDYKSDKSSNLDLTRDITLDRGREYIHMCESVIEKKAIRFFISITSFKRSKYVNF